MNVKVTVRCRCLGCGPDAREDMKSPCDDDADGEDGLCAPCRGIGPKWVGALIISTLYESVGRIGAEDE